MSVTVEAENVQLSEEFIEASYEHKFTTFDSSNQKIKIENKNYCFKTRRSVGKVGLLMVGLGGNNGTTILGGLLANRNKLTWNTKKGEQTANMYGSMTQCSTMKVAETASEEIFLPFKDIVPLLDPTQLVIGGWDINSVDMADAMRRAEVFDYELQQKLAPEMRRFKPMKSIYYSDFIASNQSDRADNILDGDNQNKLAHLKQIREDISSFKAENGLDKVIILWTANTERFAVLSEIHEDYESFMQGIHDDHPEISPSMIFAMAAMQEDCVFINGSPQNTLCAALTAVPGSKGILVGNDFKTGQTKFKTAFVDFLTGSGIKPKSCVSYNHLGNNDGKNLSSERQFKSKEASKSECIKDILVNSKLYKDETEFPDHTVVIKYVPEAGDSKKAIDEYCSEIFMGGSHTFVSYNVCEDSLLAAGIIIDLIVLSELMTRISYKKEQNEWSQISGIVAFLGFLMKAPQSTGPIINSLNRQRTCIENLFRVLSGLPLEDHLLLNYRL